MAEWKPCKNCKTKGYTGNFRVCSQCGGRGFVKEVKK